MISSAPKGLRQRNHLPDDGHLKMINEHVRRRPNTNENSIPLGGSVGPRARLTGPTSVVSAMKCREELGLGATASKRVSFHLVALAI